VTDRVFKKTTSSYSVTL